MQTLDPVGWFGKLPSLGDFASRRLPPPFVEAWDDWLSAGLCGWRAAAPDGWLQAYLAAPSWRFLLLPGALPGPAGAHAWAGTLMPSVDRVGRYFPFTLAQPLRHPPGTPAESGALLALLQRLDDLAADAMQQDWTIERLEAALAREHLSATGAADEPAPAGHGPQPDLAAFARAPRMHGHALWIGSDLHGRPLLRRHRGLPAGDAFAALFGGASVSASGDDPFSEAIDHNDHHEH